MANTLAVLNAALDLQLDDADDTAWTSAEKDALITRAVAGLWPRTVRPLDPFGTGAEVTLVADTYSYAVPAGFLAVHAVERKDSSGDEVGGVDGQAWHTSGDPLAGTFKIGVAPYVVEQGGTLRLFGYGRYGCATTTLATSAAADNIIDTAAAAAHGFAAGAPVIFTALTGGTGLSVDTTYWVIAANLASTTFQVSTTRGGSAVDFSSDITAGVVSDDYLIPDDYVPLVLATARAEAYRRVAGERVRFEQWQSRSQQQNVTVNALLGYVSEADRERERLERRAVTWRRPVAGRLGS